MPPSQVSIPPAAGLSLNCIRATSPCHDHYCSLQFAKIKPAIQPGSGRGLVATADIQPGEPIIDVPVSAAIRVFPGCPPALGVPEAIWQQLPWYGQLALTLLAEQRQGQGSKWADYIRQLPAAGDVDVPVVWGEAEVQQLQCAYFIEQVSGSMPQADRMTQSGSWNAPGRCLCPVGCCRHWGQPERRLPACRTFPDPLRHTTSQHAPLCPCRCTSSSRIGPRCSSRWRPTCLPRASAQSSCSGRCASHAAARLQPPTHRARLGLSLVG